MPHPQERTAAVIQSEQSVLRNYLRLKIARSSAVTPTQLLEEMKTDVLALSGGNFRNLIEVLSQEPDDIQTAVGTLPLAVKNYTLKPDRELFLPHSFTSIVLPPTHLRYLNHCL